jgi:hypothetical protein
MSERTAPARRVAAVRRTRGGAGIDAAPGATGAVLAPVAEGRAVPRARAGRRRRMALFLRPLGGTIASTYDA